MTRNDQGSVIGNQGQTARDKRRLAARQAIADLSRSEDIFRRSELLLARLGEKTSDVEIAADGSLSIGEGIAV